MKITFLALLTCPHVRYGWISFSGLQFAIHQCQYLNKLMLISM